MLERSARVVALACIVFGLWLAWFGTASRDRATTDAPPLGDPNAVAAWLADPRTEEGTVALDAMPSQAVRALLHAGQQAGIALAWRPSPRAQTVMPFAISAEALRDPRGGMVVRVVADRADSVPVRLLLRDAVGVLDSAPLREGGAQWVVRGAPRAVSVMVGASDRTVAGSRTAGAVNQGAAPIGASLASATPTAAGPLRRVLVLGVPSWETRFTMLALEESGWAVDGAVALSPTAGVVTGTAAAARGRGVAQLDSSRYAAVIALDSSAWVWGARIAAFVRQGGGAVVMAAAAAGAPPSFPRVAGVTDPLPPIPGALSGARPMEGLPLRPLTVREDETVVLDTDRRTGQPLAAVAARTVGAGRVLQVGWGELWEWRMGGAEDAVEAHRAWWRQALARVAPRADAGDLARRYPGDAAPYADLVARLGAPSPGTGSGVTESMPGARDTLTTRTDAAPRGVHPPLWLLVAAALLLITEWWSRRLRGAR